MFNLRNIILLTLAIVFSSGIFAGDLEDGDAAYAKNDFSTALRKYKSAAAQGNVNAQAALGAMYNGGQGVGQDSAEAMRWYKLAAAQGSAKAQFNLGLKHFSGIGVVQDYAETLRLWLLAAAQGDADAQGGLGLMYNQEVGVVQDFVRAHMWYNLAGANGNSAAIKLRDNVAKQMTPQQIAQAQKLARECQARNFKNCD